MNYPQENPNSLGISNKNNLGVSHQVIQLTGNYKRIFFQAEFVNIIGIKVNGITFATPPTNLTNGNVLMLCCDDLIENTMNQSNLIVSNPDDPSGASQNVISKSILAKWIIINTGTSQYVPNYAVANFEQDTIWFARPTRFSSLQMFLITEDLTNILSFNSSNKVFLNVTLYYYQPTRQ